MPAEENLTVRPEDIKRLAELVEQNGLSELRYEQGDLRITLRTAAYRPAQVTYSSLALPVSSSVGEGLSPVESLAPPADTHDEDGEDADNQVRVEAPIMGKFYRAAKPEDPPFVEVGDTVEVGQVVGLIEAMKTFSEVPAEVAGVVQAIPVKNGAMVQAGDALIVLAPQ